MNSFTAPRRSPLERQRRMANRCLRMAVALLVLGWAMSLVAQYAPSTVPRAIAFASLSGAVVAWLVAAWRAAHVWCLQQCRRDPVVVRRLLGVGTALGLAMVGAGAGVWVLAHDDPRPLFIGAPTAGVVLAGLLLALGLRYVLASVAAWHLLMQARTDGVDASDSGAAPRS